MVVREHLPSNVVQTVQTLPLIEDVALGYDVSQTRVSRRKGVDGRGPSLHPQLTGGRIVIHGHAQSTGRVRRKVALPIIHAEVAAKRGAAASFARFSAVDLTCGGPFDGVIIGPTDGIRIAVYSAGMVLDDGQTVLF